MIRRKGREIALQVLYQIDITGSDPETALKAYKEHLNLEDEKAFSFGEELVRGVFINLDFIDNLIQRYTPSWPLERLNLTDKNILRLAIYEFFFRPDIPPIVSINEAVELAKIYGTDESPSFVNGVLDSIYKHELLKKEKAFFK
ncbi:MAG: transcription antitermination factor NusB [Caldimicrobium sp.]